MEKDKSPGSGLPPHSNRYPAFPSTSNPFGLKSDQSSSPAPATPDSGHFGPDSGHFGPDSGRFSHDISRMPDFPPKNRGHRRAHSEILGLPDDISFDSDLGVVGSGDGPSFSDDTEEDLLSMYLNMENMENMENFTSSCATSGLQLGEPSGSAVGANENMGTVSSERSRVRHQHSQSMDGSTSIKPELLVSGGEGSSMADTKKAMSAAKLADLALMDPKRAKRIWANRQSAARSKERKMRYIAELERKVQTLQTEATTLSAQLAMLQRDTNGLTAENNELKLRLQTMDQQVHLQDALNDALREEVQRLKLITGQAVSNGGQMMNFGSSFGANQQFYPHNNNAMHTLLAAQQLQQLQIRSQHQQQQQQHHQPTTDLKMKGPFPSPNQRDNASDSS
ncbi:basic-leucine zipper (bZIP) transcription factor family protein isoform X1 [Tasmannia lanceolata]|uniref:basic-leucine zipper (bZIP) transcription factor family protein isoform X1 n=1 Tax=Tasmannia lanceolata TaxID=3420 RepID=UPI004063BE67